MRSRAGSSRACDRPVHHCRPDWSFRIDDHREPRLDDSTPHYFLHTPVGAPLSVLLHITPRYHASYSVPHPTLAHNILYLITVSSPQRYRSLTTQSVFMFFPPSVAAPPVTLPPLLGISKPLPPLMSPQPILSPTKFPSLMPAELGVSTEMEQIKSYRSLVAPFATPPVSPTVPMSPVRPKTTSESTIRTHHSTGKSDGHDDGPKVEDGGLSFGTQDGTGITGSTRTHTNASAYAWSLLAEHLRLPENAMGMMVEATENDQRGWQATRREAEHMLVPQNVSAAGVSRSTVYTCTSTIPFTRVAYHPNTPKRAYL
jgi:hypothetical protein